MKKIIVVTIILTLLIMSLIGCIDTFEKTQYMYFDGDVIVVYESNSRVGEMSYFTFEFYTKDNYTIEFRTGDTSLETPQDFSIEVKSIPRKHIIEQDCFPDNLVVKIICEDQEESHIFTW